MKGLSQFNTVSTGSFCSEKTAQVAKGLFGLMWFVVLDSKRFHTWPPGRTNQKPRANQRPNLTSLFHNIEKSSAGFSSLQFDPCDSVFVLTHKHYITLSWVRWTSPAFQSLSCCWKMKDYFSKSAASMCLSETHTHLQWNVSRLFYQRCTTVCTGASLKEEEHTVVSLCLSSFCCSPWKFKESLLRVRLALNFTPEIRFVGLSCWTVLQQERRKCRFCCFLALPALSSWTLHHVGPVLFAFQDCWRALCFAGFCETCSLR